MPSDLDRSCHACSMANPESDFVVVQDSELGYRPAWSALPALVSQDSGSLADEADPAATRWSRMGLSSSRFWWGK